MDAAYPFMINSKILDLPFCSTEMGICCPTTKEG